MICLAACCWSSLLPDGHRWNMSLEWAERITAKMFQLIQMLMMQFEYIFPYQFQSIEQLEKFPKQAALTTTLFKSTLRVPPKMLQGKSVKSRT